MKTSSSLLSLTTAAAVLLFAGCGKSSSESTSAAPAAPAAQTPPAKPAPKEGRAVEIVGNDSMKFNVVEIHAKAGEALAVTMKNGGTMPKFSMGHNWVLLSNDVRLADFANEASLWVKTEYLPPKYLEQVIAHTKLLGPNESDTVLFYAPEKAGRYNYLCTFPGHFQVGMKGVLIVE